jgi:hypothetical protein
MTQKDLKRQNDLKKQADRADSIADQTVDDAMKKKTLRDAAEEYRDEAEEQERKTLETSDRTS